jgi:hypothetical protein
LFVVPVLYVLIVGLEERFRPRRKNGGNGAITTLGEPSGEPAQTGV